MSDETNPTEENKDWWAFSREAEAAAKQKSDQRDAKFNGFLDGFKRWGDDLAKGWQNQSDHFNKKIKAENDKQQERLKDLDTPEEPVVDNRPTPAEAWTAMKMFARRTGKNLGQYFDLTYRRITHEQAVKELQDHLIKARLGGEKEVAIIGGRSIEKKEDGSYYAEPFSIEKSGDLWIVNREGRSVVYARNLDEAVKAVIRSYVRDDEDSKGEHANARTSLESPGPVSG